MLGQSICNRIIVSNIITVQLILDLVHFLLVEKFYFSLSATPVDGRIS